MVCHVFCTSYKIFFAHAHSQLREMGRNWVANQLRMQQEMEAKQDGGNYNAYNHFVKGK